MLEVTVTETSPEDRVSICIKVHARIRTLTGDLHVLSELACLAIDLNAVVKVLFEGRAVKDTVASRARVVNDELVLSSGLGSGDLGLH